MSVDLSAPAVERLAEYLMHGWHRAEDRDCAATLRALVAERDRLRAALELIADGLQAVGDIKGCAALTRFALAAAVEAAKEDR